MITFLKKRRKVSDFYWFLAYLCLLKDKYRLQDAGDKLTRSCLPYQLKT